MSQTQDWRGFQPLLQLIYKSRVICSNPSLSNDGGLNGSATEGRRVDLETCAHVSQWRLFVRGTLADQRPLRLPGEDGSVWKDQQVACGRESDKAQVLEDTRRQALDRMVSNASLMGANAVISMRFDSSELNSSMSEIVAYGTAVVIEPDAGAPQPLE